MSNPSIAISLLAEGWPWRSLALAGGWATTTELSGAVIAQGQLIVESNVKKVQHPTGGVVGELRVHEGDHVNAGDIVLHLDETQTRANLAIFTKGLAS
jgi:HlyD family secretion protein